MKNLPKPIESYYQAKNLHNIDQMLLPFAQEAVVFDEGQNHKGKVDIKEWMLETTKKYKVTATPVSFEQKDSEFTVKASVAGNFQGSPLLFTYVFKIQNDQITYLKIGV